MIYFGDILKEVRKIYSSGLLEIYDLQDNLICQVQLKEGGVGEGEIINKGVPQTVFIATCNSAVETPYERIFDTCSNHYEWSVGLTLNVRLEK